MLDVLPIALLGGVLGLDVVSFPQAMAFALIGLGVRQLSVAPRSVPLVKRIVRGISVEVAEEAANSAAAKKTAAEAGEELRRRLAGVMVDEALFADGLPTGELGSSL